MDDEKGPPAPPPLPELGPMSMRRARASTPAGSEALQGGPSSSRSPRASSRAWSFAESRARIQPEDGPRTPLPPSDPRSPASPPSPAAKQSMSPPRSPGPRSSREYVPNGPPSPGPSSLAARATLSPRQRLLSGGPVSDQGPEHPDVPGISPAQPTADPVSDRSDPRRRNPTPARTPAAAAAAPQPLTELDPLAMFVDAATAVQQQRASMDYLLGVEGAPEADPVSAAKSAASNEPTSASMFLGQMENREYSTPPARDIASPLGPESALFTRPTTPPPVPPSSRGSSVPRTRSFAVAVSGTPEDKALIDSTQEQLQGSVALAGGRETPWGSPSKPPSPPPPPSTSQRSSKMSQPDREPASRGAINTPSLSPRLLAAMQSSLDHEPRPRTSEDFLLDSVRAAGALMTPSQRATSEELMYLEDRKSSSLRAAVVPVAVDDADDGGSDDRVSRSVRFGAHRSDEGEEDWRAPPPPHDSDRSLQETKATLAAAKRKSEEKSAKRKAVQLAGTPSLADSNASLLAAACGPAADSTAGDSDAESKQLVTYARGTAGGRESKPLRGVMAVSKAFNIFRTMKNKRAGFESSVMHGRQTAKSTLKSAMKGRVVKDQHAGGLKSLIGWMVHPRKAGRGYVRHVRFKEPVSRQTLKLIRFAIIMCRPGSHFADYWKLWIACLIGVSFLLVPFIGVEQRIERALHQRHLGFRLDNVVNQLFLVERVVDVLMLLNVVFEVTEAVLEDLGLHRTMIDKIVDSSYLTSAQEKQLQDHVNIVVRALQTEQPIWTERVHKVVRRRLTVYSITTFPRVLLEVYEITAHHSMHWSLFVGVSCLRAYQLVDLFRFWSNIQQDFSKNVSLCVVAKFAFMIFSVAHTLGCVYYYMAALSNFSMEIYKENWLDDWIMENDIDYSHKNKDLGSMYLIILYRGFNVLTALGYQEEVPFRGDEIALSIVGNYVKIVAEAYIFGLIFHYLVKPNPEVQANQRRLAAVEQYCDARNLPQELKTRLSKYIQFQQGHASAVSDQVLTAVPTSLKERIAAERCTSVVARNMHVFGGCSKKFLSRFMMCLHEVHLMPSEVLLKAGDIARELSFVEVGNLQILDHTDQVVEIVAGEGATPCVVGATSFFMGVPEQYKTCARDGEECALLAINKATCNDVIASLPEENDIITTNILAQYGLTKEGEETGAAAAGGGGGGENDAFAAIQESIKLALKQTQDRSLEQLTYAASEGDVETVEMLIARGCPINTGDYDQRTPLHLAVAKGQKFVVQLLLDRGAKVSPVDRWGSDPLKDALLLNHLDIADILISKGAKLHSDEYFIIREAASHSLSKLQRITLKGGANADVGDCDSRTLLHCASALGDFNMVQNLIAVGANPHKKDRWGGTPIEDAIKNNQALITAFLAMQGARASTKYQQEALFHAAQYGSVQLVNILAESGANLSSQNYDQISAMHVAASENNVAALAAIISNRYSNVNLKDNWGRTPLDYAVASRSWPCVVLLGSQGGAVTDSDGRAAISAASTCKHLPSLHLVRQSLNCVTESRQPDAAALGALYGVQNAEAANLVLTQQRKLLCSNLKTLRSLKRAGADIGTALNEVLAIATVLHEVLTVCAPKGLSKSLTKTASMLAKPRKSLTKALMPVLMRGTAVQEACQELAGVVDRATAATGDKDAQLRFLFKAICLRVDQMSIDASIPLWKSFWQCFAGPAGMEELNVFALLSCPVFRRVVEEGVFNIVRDAATFHKQEDAPLVLKVATCMKWSDELWSAMVPHGSTFDMASVAPMVYQVLKTLSLDHLWDVLSKLLEERHDSLSQANFSYVFFMWLGMSEQIAAEEEDPGQLKRGSFLSRRISSFTFGDLKRVEEEEDDVRSSNDADEDREGEEADAELQGAGSSSVAKWFSLFEQAEHATEHALTAAANADADKEAHETKQASATDDDRRWLEELIKAKGPKSALKKLLRLTLRERLESLVGLECDNLEKGRRIFESVNKSGSGLLPASVLDVLTSHYQQDLRFNRTALDLVERYQDAKSPLSQEDFDEVFALLSSPGDDAKLPSDAPWYIIHPNSRVLRQWNWCMVGLAVWFLWEVPFSIAFRPEHSFGENFMDTNEALELVFFCDVLANFVRAFYSDNGTMVYHPNKIRRAYMAQYSFPIDVIAFFPFNMLRTIGAHGRTVIHIGAWFRLPRLVAVARVILYRRDGWSLFHQHYSTSGEISAGVMFKRIMTLLFGVTVLTHLLGCCWWYIGTLGQPHTRDAFEDKYGEIDYDKLPPAWIFYYHGLGYGNLWDDKVPVLVQYYYSFYWTASTLSTSGLVGETTPKNLMEIAFTIVCMLCTITVWAYVMGEISNLVMSSSERLVAIREKVQLVQTFLRKRQLTRALANDIVSVFYEKVHTNNDTAQVFSSLSSSLMFEVAMHLSLPLVKSLEIFSTCSSSFVASLSVLLRERQLASDEALFLLGDAATSLYILASSSITLTVPGIGDEDAECGRLGPGSVVGEVAFFFRLRHINSAIVGAKAATLFVLSRQDYDQLCSSYVYDSELVMKKMVDMVNGGSKAGASQASSNNGDVPDNVRRTLQIAVKRQTESVTLALIEAASKGHAQVVREMVDAGRVHIDDGDFDARTALHLAVSNNHLDLVQTILNDFGAAIAPRDRCMGTPLDDAVRHRHFEIVRYLATSHLLRIEITTKYIDMWIQAAASDDLELIQVLLMAGMDCNVANMDNRTALHVAVCKRAFRVVRHLLTLQDLELGAMDRVGSTPMWDALVACDAELCQMLSDKQAPVQEDIAIYMCNAAAADNATFIDLACAHDVDVLCRDLFGRTPLHVAASNGALRCVDAMARKLEGKVNTVDVFGNTPLDNAEAAADDVAVAILRHAGGLNGSDPSLSKAHADLKAWSDASRRVRQAEHLETVVAHLPEARTAKESAAVAQALRTFVRVMYSNTNIFTVALHEAAKKQTEALNAAAGSRTSSQTGSQCGEMACGSTSAESRVKAALAAIVTSLTELRDVVATRPKPYTAIDHPLLRKVSGHARGSLAQIRDTLAALEKVIGLASKVLASLEQKGLRLQSFAVKRLLSMLSSGIWEYLNVKVPEVVMSMSDDELSYVKNWDRSDVHQHMLEKLERCTAKRKSVETEQPREAVTADAPTGTRQLKKDFAKAEEMPDDEE